MALSAVDRRIRELRPPKPRVDAWKAHGTLLERERRPNGLLEHSYTVFLAGAECAFTCSFCDLWRYTIDGPTPLGAIPAQLQRVLRGRPRPIPHRLKLYNASNFFDARAVPLGDWTAIAKLTAPFPRVTVESHARTVGPRTLEFAKLLNARLEVAIGLETIHPEAMARLNKRLDLEGFERAAGFLAEHDIDLRVFALVGAPHVPADETVDWACRSAELAVRLGAATVALIPVRGGNGELERLAALGHFVPPTLADLETALDRCLGLSPAVVTADLWDFERIARCAACRPARGARLERLNLTGRPEPRVTCAECGAA
jgi:archaeosine synthase beta-subunit